MRASSSGQSILPSRWVRASGFRAISPATAKNTRLYASCHKGGRVLPSSAAWATISKLVLAVRGMASPGPMAR